jgi:hypothetical protein
MGVCEPFPEIASRVEGFVPEGGLRERRLGRSNRFAKLAYVPNARYSGYFHSDKYFGHNLKEIQRLFKLSDRTIDACGIHVRRGDYLSVPHVLPVLPIEYYRAAVDLLFVSGPQSDLSSIPTIRPGSARTFCRVSRPTASSLRHRLMTYTISLA